MNFASRTIRLDVGTTKNREGREVVMTAKVAELLRQAVEGKAPDGFVLTRADGKPVRTFGQRGRTCASGLASATSFAEVARAR
jgi:hypothetical protein